MYAHSAGHPVELYSTLVGMSKKSYQKIRDILFRNVVLHIPDREGNVKTVSLKHTAHKRGRIWCDRSRGKPDWSELLPDGTVCLCCMDFGIDYILGNLLTQSYGENHARRADARVVAAHEVQKTRRGFNPSRVLTTNHSTFDAVSVFY